MIATALGMLGGCTSVDTTPIQGSWKHYAIFSDHLDITPKTITVHGKETATYTVIDHGPDFFVLECEFSASETRNIRIDVVAENEILFEKKSYMRRDGAQGNNADSTENGTE